MNSLFHLILSYFNWVSICININKFSMDQFGNKLSSGYLGSPVPKGSSVICIDSSRDFYAIWHHRTSLRYGDTAGDDTRPIFMSCCNISRKKKNIVSLEHGVIILKCNLQIHFADSVHELLLCNCSLMDAAEHIWWQFNIGSGNGLVPSGNKPLPEPMLTKACVDIWRH